jgi:long-subunit acyl-CoA synthetase (AMP-forming)
MHAKTPLEMLYQWEQTEPDRIYLRQPVNREFREMTWREVGLQVRRLASALIAQNYPAGSHIAILSKNCAEWFITDMAILMAGHVSVPIYATAGEETVRYVLTHSHCRAIFLGKSDQALQQSQAIPTGITRFAFPYPEDLKGVDIDHSWQELQSQPELGSSPVPANDDTMTIIYTSGSTGNPKGVVITVGAYAWSCETLGRTMPTYLEDRVLSYLPLAHITERVIIEGASLYNGFQVSFVESLDTFTDDLKAVSPTLFLSVPRLWTRFQMGILAKVPPHKLDRMLSIPLLKGWVAKKIRKQLGFEHVRLFGSGSAPLSPATIAWYQKLGIQITEAWGMSETSALGTTCYPFRADKVGSIGRPYDGVDLRLSDEGEIQVKGPFLMKEYYLEPDKTAETFTSDGYLKTGDKGEMDADGYVKITGRLKEIFKTAKGKYVTPVPIEARLMENSLIEQICVTGSHLKQPVALAVLTPEAANHDQQHITRSLEHTLSKVNQALESHQQLDAIIIINDSWSIDNGLLTPTLKIRRHLIEARYHDNIHQPLTATVMW